MQNDHNIEVYLSIDPIEKNGLASIVKMDPVATRVKAFKAWLDTLIQLTR